MAGIEPTEMETISLLEDMIWNQTKNLERQQNGQGLLESYKQNRSLDQPYFSLFICAYVLLAGVGSLGNCLVIISVIRKPTMRTARNLFIINLAASDLLLCFVTMPLTCVELLSIYWPLPRSVLICKMVGSLQAVSVFVSTISITTIALDRYQVIVYPTNQSLQRLGAVLALVAIWMLSCLLALPLFIVRNLRHYPLDFKEIGLTGIDFCLEEWPTDHGRPAYSIFTIIFQYLMPVTIVSFAYMGICKKLRMRMRPGSSSAQMTCQRAGGNDRDQNSQNRVRRTNLLLISIAIIFGVSWLPLNVLNLVADLDMPFKDQKERFLILYGLCHMLGMSSACSNPVLYGWLNENFRKEFKEILFFARPLCCGRCRKTDNNNGTVPGRSSVRRVDREQTTVLYKKSKASPAEDGELEQSILITQVLK